MEIDSVLREVLGDVESLVPTLCPPHKVREWVTSEVAQTRNANEVWPSFSNEADVL